MNNLRLILFVFVAFTINAQQLYFQSKVGGKGHQQSLGFSNEKIVEAIQFAIKNENPVNRNLKEAIISAFGHEPGFEIKGPTKPRKGPNGLIIKDGYIIGKLG